MSLNTALQLILLKCARLTRFGHYLISGKTRFEVYEARHVHRLVWRKLILKRFALKVAGVNQKKSDLAVTFN